MRQFNTTQRLEQVGVHKILQGKKKENVNIGRNKFLHPIIRIRLNIEYFPRSSNEVSFNFVLLVIEIDMQKGYVGN